MEGIQQNYCGSGKEHMLSVFNFVLIYVIVWAGPPSGCYQKGAKEDFECKEAREGVPCLPVRS